MEAASPSATIGRARSATEIAYGSVEGFGMLGKFAV
jgi:hypothetical protein